MNVFRTKLMKNHFQTS